MKVSLHPSSRAELREAYRWYHERSPLSAIAFAHSLDVAISRITEAPFVGSPAEHDTRRFVLQQFPFHIFYKLEKAEIVIIALAHQRRRPGYWTGRLP